MQIVENKRKIKAEKLFSAAADACNGKSASLSYHSPCLSALKLLAFFLMFLLMSASALAFGVRPAKSEILFVPGDTAAGSFTIVNNEMSAQNLRMYVEGPASAFVFIPEKFFTIDAGKEKVVVFYVEIPASVLSPSFDIYISPDTGTEGVGAVVRIAHKVVFKEPIVSPVSAAVAEPRKPAEEQKEFNTQPSQQPFSQAPQPSTQTAATSQPFDISLILVVAGGIFLLASFELWLRARKHGTR